MIALRPAVIALDRATAAWAPELKYVFRTLCRIAGAAYEFVWADGDGREAGWTVYYGPRSAEVTAPIRFYGERDLRIVASQEPVGLMTVGDLSCLCFDNASGGHEEGPGDPIASAYWLLSGIFEPNYPRDRDDNLHLTDSFFLKRRLAERPLVSEYGAWLRRCLARSGVDIVDPPWVQGGRRSALALTHDVDYPEIIRWVEFLRLLARRGIAGTSAALNVVRRRSHFWKFADWMSFAESLGGRSAFFFLGRKGSLLQYATGTPDGFYDVRSPRFERLFAELRERGHEIGLHHSFHAHRSEIALGTERDRLSSAAGVPVVGGRHHYWHLDPDSPHDTLLKQERVGFEYDSSLAFEFYPGFRRGICHPFRPYHPGERRELDLVELPPTWMDDHYDRRRRQNGIEDPDRHATGLLGVIGELRGVAVLDYHVRGMNGELFPNHGPWLTRYLPEHIDSTVSLSTPERLAADYSAICRTLAQSSGDRAHGIAPP